MKICFWSNVHGQAGVTSSLIAISLYNTIQFKNKNAVMQTHYTLNSLTRSILGVNFVNTDIGIGVDALIRDIKVGPISEENANDDSISILNGMYSVFLETNRENKTPYEEDVLKLYNPILDQLSTYYDNIYIDVASGYGESSMRILENADIVVVCLSQSRTVIEEYMKEPLPFKNLIFLFGNYDAYSKYNVKNLRRSYEFLRSNPCITIPHSSSFLDALNEGHVAEFFYRKSSTTKDSKDTMFIQSVKGAVAAINKKGEKILENT